MYFYKVDFTSGKGERFAPPGDTFPSSLHQSQFKIYSRKAGRMISALLFFLSKKVNSKWSISNDSGEACVRFCSWIPTL
jgi:hypothetical protein